MTRKTLFVDGWRFLKASLETDMEAALSRIKDFEEVNIPHDWLIYNVDNLYEDGKGFYEKTFIIKKEASSIYEIYFEGVYMDTTVYVNGKKLGEWKYGYSSFFFDMTKLLKDGENTIVVEIRHQSPNTRWYSGAGIFRDVYLIEKKACSFITDGIYISNTKSDKQNWKTTCIAECSGEIEDEDDFLIELYDEKNNLVESKKQRNAKDISKEDNTTLTLKSDIDIIKPKLWSIEEPKLYTIKLSWIRNEEILDETNVTIGYKDIVFDTDKGLFLNGRAIKLNGVCEHHDLGALGSAFHKDALRRKFEMLKDMGINAIRTSHNMPAVGLMELADEMGFLIVDEAFDMWEGPKTTYDYARFFKEWYEKDVRSWIRRDRNHVSLLMWSIGNEIYDTHAGERGQEVTRMLKSAVEKHDYLFNAHATIGSNYMPWENARKCADILKYAGYNYAERYYEEHHREHPDWFIYGSETASTVQSRGIYHFPFKQAMLANDDEQCSSLGNCTTSWGADRVEQCLIAQRDYEFALGQFIWTGFDYIGEPTPYQTRNSYFGQIDTAGFPKDNFYLYRSSWSDKDTLHIFPYWKWNKNQLIDMRVATNAPFVELFVNGRSYGCQKIDHEKGTVLTGNWQVPYEDGEVLAISYDKNKKEIARAYKHSFGDATTIKLSSYKESLEYKRGAVGFVSVEAYDENGYLVENANNRIIAAVKNGYILGMDNGDSTDLDEYKTDNKRLFNGKLLIMVAPDGNGDIELEVKGKGLAKEKIIIPVNGNKKTTNVSPVINKISHEIKEDNIWAREIEIVSKAGQEFSKELTSIEVEAKIYPKEAMEFIKPEDIIWKATNDSGIESSLAKIEADGFKAKITALGDGEFRLRCMVKNGCEKVKVISSLEFTARDLGICYLNPYNFIAGGLFSYSEGDLGNGNDHGVSTARVGRSVVGFDNIDFGEFGSDTVTIPIFELGGDPTPIQIWDGIPDMEGSTLLADVVYHKPSKWNVYQEETYKLSKRLKGIGKFFFVLNSKIHIKGFSFEKQIKVLETIYAAECDNVYGDSFMVSGKAIKDIGNNVTIEYKNMDFGENGVNEITICGQTSNEINSIHLLVEAVNSAEKTGNRREIFEFTGTDKKEMRFSFDTIKGQKNIVFVFLPGCKFDFDYFKFS